MTVVVASSVDGNTVGIVGRDVTSSLVGTGEDNQISNTPRFIIGGLIELIGEGELKRVRSVGNIKLDSVGFFLRITSTAQVLVTTPSIRLGHALNNNIIN